MILSNGTVLPHGLLNAQGYEAAVAGFNRSFKNTGLKAGFVIKSYAANDPASVYNLCTEYDVQTIEQDENKGSTAILYRHCLGSQGFGSIADYFEYTLRPQTYQAPNSPSFNGQDGAIVLLQCLDGIGSKAIVVGTLIHPDRPTTITSTDPQLGFTYNGINVTIANDGSFGLTFNGATDSKGVPINPSQGITSFQIQTDGSYRLTNSAVTILCTKAGVVNITSTSDANITVGGNTAITTTGTANIIAQGLTTIDGSTIELGVGAVEAVVKGNTFAQIYDQHVHTGNLGVPTGPPLSPMDPSLSKHTFTK